MIIRAKLEDRDPWPNKAVIATLNDGQTKVLAELDSKGAPFSLDYNDRFVVWVCHSYSDGYAYPSVTAFDGTTGKCMEVWSGVWITASVWLDKGRNLLRIFTKAHRPPGITPPNIYTDYKVDLDKKFKQVDG